MKISIVTAIYNAADTVGDAIDSVARQTHDDIEHVIVDGASTDGSLETVDRHRHARMSVASEPDNGIYDALNKGIRRATGAVVGLVHSDDYLAHDDVLSDIAAAFADPAVEAVYGDLDYVAKADTAQVIRHWTSGAYSRDKLARGWMPPHPTLYLRKSVFDRVGYYDTAFRIAADYDFVLRYFTSTQAHPVYLPQVLVKMRVGGESNRNLRKILQKMSEDRQALSRNGVGGMSTLAMKNLSKIPQFFKKGA